MNMNEIEKKLKNIEQRQHEISLKMEPYQTELEDLVEERNALLEERDKQILEARPDDWEWLLQCDLKESQTKNDARDTKLRELGLTCYGRWAEIEQPCIIISLEENRLEKMYETLKGLSKILPYIKSLPGRGQVVEISCDSPAWPYSLEFREDKFFLSNAGIDIQNFPDLESALWFVQREIVTNHGKNL